MKTNNMLRCIQSSNDGLILKDVELRIDPFETIRVCRMWDGREVMGIRTKETFEKFFIMLGQSACLNTKKYKNKIKDDGFYSLLGKIALDFEITNDYYIETEYDTDEPKFYKIKAQEEEDVKGDLNVV